MFFAELNEVLTRELAEDGYSGVEVRVTPMRTEIIIRATRTQNVLGLSPIPPSSIAFPIDFFSNYFFIYLFFWIDLQVRKEEESES